MTPPDTVAADATRAQQPRAVAGQQLAEQLAALPRRRYDDAAGRHHPGRVRGAESRWSRPSSGGGGAAAPRGGVEPSTPIIFLDTDKLFGETRRYRDRSRPSCA